jgi:hypothetical protein
MRLEKTIIEEEDDDEEEEEDGNRSFPYPR